MNRRDLLAKSLQVGAGLYIVGQANPLEALAKSKKKNVFVYVFLRGGADVLSLLQMTKGQDFNKLKNYRKGYALPKANLIKNTDIKIHHQMNFIKSLLESNKAHAVLGTGSMNETRSHFLQMDYIESGSSVSVLPKGFLAKALGLVSNKDLGITVGSSLDLSLSGGRNTKKINGESDLKVLQNSAKGQSHKDFVQTMLGMYKNRFLTHQDADRSLTSTANGVKPLTEADLSAYEVFQSLKSGKLSNVDMTAKALIASDQTPLIITTNIHGWDTHSDASDRIEKLAIELDAHIKNIFSAFDSDTNAEVVVMSEFGRTVSLNGAKGFDHGRGSAMLFFSNTRKFSKPISGQYKLNSREIEVLEDYRRPLTEALSKWASKSKQEIAGEVFSSEYRHKNYRLY